jgi:hypothetical protein
MSFAFVFGHHTSHTACSSNAHCNQEGYCCVWNVCVEDKSCTETGQIEPTEAPPLFAPMPDTACSGTSQCTQVGFCCVLNSCVQKESCTATSNTNGALWGAVGGVVAGGVLLAAVAAVWFKRKAIRPLCQDVLLRRHKGTVGEENSDRLSMATPAQIGDDVERQMTDRTMISTAPIKQISKQDRYFIAFVILLLLMCHGLTTLSVLACVIIA